MTMRTNRSRLNCIALLIVVSVSTSSTVSAQATPSATSVRHSDSLLNGALIGAGVAVASGLALCRTTEPWRNCRDDYGPMLRIGALGAGIGLAIDALIRGRRTTRPNRLDSTHLYASPILNRRGGGLQMSITF